MSERIYIGVTGAVLDLVFLFHLFRILFDWRAEIGEFVVPMWVSWAALAISGYLAVSAFFLMRK